MSVEQMRCAIADAYKKSKTWKEKVLRMSDAQVIAIYHSFLSTGKIK